MDDPDRWERIWRQLRSLGDPKVWEQLRIQASPLADPKRWKKIQEQLRPLSDPKVLEQLRAQASPLSDPETMRRLQKQIAPLGDPERWKKIQEQLAPIADPKALEQLREDLANLQDNLGEATGVEHSNTEAAIGHIDREESFQWIDLLPTANQRRLLLSVLMVLNSVLVLAATSPASLPLTLGLIAQPLI